MLARAFSSWGRLVGWGRESVPEDRRVWVRHPCAVETTLRPAGDPGTERVDARVMDISQGGIQLTVNRPFESGDLLSVELPGPEQSPACTVLTYVVRVDEIGPTAWSLGCTF